MEGNVVLAKFSSVAALKVAILTSDNFQLSKTTLMKISSSWHHFRFSGQVLIKVSEWRHMGVMASNHRHLDCLFETFSLTIRQPPRFRITLFYEGNPSQCPVMCKECPHVFTWRQIEECIAFWWFRLPLKSKTHLRRNGVKYSPLRTGKVFVLTF